MARKCSSCGIPAPDGESKFCNRCGSAILDDIEPQLPVCGTCGMTVADPHAEFCDKCGGQVRKTASCPSCGNPAIDENSRFCTRCGMTFLKPGTCPSCGFLNPDKQAAFCNRCGSALRDAGQAASPSVVITKKRVALPVKEEPAPDWDPWTDGSPEPETHTSTPAPQVRVPPKKYAHLPLIADELKDAKKPYSGSDGSYESMSKDPSGKKKGGFGILKR